MWVLFLPWKGVLLTLNPSLLLFVVIPGKMKEGKTLSLYIRAELLHAEKDLEWRSESVKTTYVLDEGADAVWDARFEWEYEQDELAFLRFVSLLHPSFR